MPEPARKPLTALEPPQQEAPHQPILFPEGLYGFRELREFAVLSVPGGGDVLKILQSLEQPDVGFVLVAPNPFFPEYQPALSEQDVAALALESPEQAIWMLLATTPGQDFQATTVNLKAPIVFNPFRRLGKQVILDGEYPVRQPLFRGQEEKKSARPEPAAERKHPDR